MHRALQRLDQFVSFNFIAAPVAFQKSVEHTSGPQLPGFEGDVISILHLYFTFLKNEKGLPQRLASTQPSGRIFSSFKRLDRLEASKNTAFLKKLLLIMIFYRCESRKTPKTRFSVPLCDP